MRSVRPADGAELRYRVLMRKVVANWWAKIGPQALRKAKKIAKPEAVHTDAGEHDEHEATDASLTDYSSEADAGWFASRVDKVAADVSRHSANELGRIGVKLSKKASIKVEPAIAKMVPKWRHENVGLVRTMFDDERTKLEKLLADGAGRRFETLARDIEQRFEISTRHAELIARDQTNKLNSRISQGRMAAAGITTYRWTTAGDERVRPLHDDLDGEVFDFDDPPVTNDDGDTNNPGEDYQCRCVAFPILPELEDDSSDDEEAVSDE
jgi:SPP1 gp7 family putative phage head morphogenesis protein